MPASAITLYSVVLAVHIFAVVVTFGALFTYPLFHAVAGRDPRALPYVYRLQYAIGSRVIAPGLAVILLAGIYLASKGDYWSEFWVQWSLGAVVVLGALSGAVFSRWERRLGELAERDGGADPEFGALARRLHVAHAAAALLVAVTVFVMTAKPFS
jgi:uncharacterized membrane protein